MTSFGSAQEMARWCGRVTGKTWCCGLIDAKIVAFLRDSGQITLSKAAPRVHPLIHL